MKRDGLYRRQGRIFAFRFKDKSGHWREKSTGEIERTEAVAFKDKWNDDNKNDLLPGRKSEWNVEQACSRYVEQHTARLKSLKARSNERSLLRQLTKRLGSRKLKNITLDDLKDYQAERSKQVRERPINLELGILVNVLKEENLWKGALERHYKRLKEPESEVGEALTAEQLRRLESTAASKDTWEIAYCAELLATNAGFRGAEIKKMRLGAIDLEKRRVLVTRKSTKSDKGARLVHLNQAAMAAICRLYRRAQQLGASQPEHYLLPADLSRHTKEGDRLKGGRGFDPTKHQMSWDTAWRNLRTAAGLDGLRFHNCRHTFITDMAELDVPRAVTQDMVGHMSEAVTRRYEHIRDKVARAAVEKLEKIRSTPSFVEVFVDMPGSAKEPDSKLLN
jgi:integrase